MIKKNNKSSMQAYIETIIRIQKDSSKLMSLYFFLGKGMSLLVWFI